MPISNPTSSIYHRLENMLDENGRLPDPEAHLQGIPRGIGVRGLIPPGYDALWVTKDLTEHRAKTVEELSRLLKSIAQGNTKYINDVRQILMDEPMVVGILEHLPRSFMEFVLHDDKYLVAAARHFAFLDSAASCVKLGIVLLGMLGMRSDWPKVRILAMHEEFTYYAAFSIQGFSDQPALSLWGLAKEVRGNGRVIAIMTLIKFSLTQEMKDWLLIDGYRLRRNSGEIAIICAVYGELEQCLSIGKDRHTGRLFSATEILNLALVNDPNQNELRIHFGFPSPNFLIQFLRHASMEKKPTWHLYLAMHRILDYLRLELDDHQAGKSRFPVDEALDLIAAINDFLDSWQARWAKSFEAGLSLPTRGIWFKWALEGAERFGMDCQDLLWQRIEKGETDPSLWRIVAERVDSFGMDRLLALAKRQSSELAIPKTLPGTMVEEGPAAEHTTTWVELIVALGRFPGKATDLLEESLASTVLRLRFAALETLSHWDKKHFTKGIRKQLNRIRKCDLMPYMRTQAENLQN